MTKEEALKILSNRDGHGIPSGYTSGYAKAIDIAIEALKAESNNKERYGEYVKVKPGRWKAVRAYPNVIMCSECNTPFERREFVAIPNYCPNCGARMDCEENVAD